jgi:spermidine synthase
MLPESSAKALRTCSLYLTLFVAGAVVLVIEIAGTRILAPFFGATVFVWSSLITITLGFLAAGYFVGGILVDRYPRRSFFYVIIFSGGAFSLFLIKLSQPLLVFSDRFGVRIGPLVGSLLLFALPLFLLSMASPFVIRLRSAKLQRSGHTCGSVFAVSTIGSLAGALLAGFYLIPSFSLSSIFFVSMLVIMACALLGLILEKSPLRTIVVTALLLGVTLLCPFVKHKDDSKVSIIHHEPSFYADLKIVELPFARALLMNGVYQSVFDRANSTSLAKEIAELKRQLSVRPADAEVLVLGFAGGVAKTIDPGYRVDFVEIEPKMVKLAKDFFDFRLDDNDEIIIADARSFLRTTDRTYDVIFVDLYKGGMIPFHTHTKEALELMRSRLKDGGVLLSNIIARQGELYLRSLVKTLRATFGKVSVAAQVGTDVESVANIVACAAVDDDHDFDFSGRFREIAVDWRSGFLITDDRNPIEILSCKHLPEFMDLTRSVFGYEVLFGL